jgi:hypothetical protein
MNFADPHCMSSREFVDQSGQTWMVWRTDPTAGGVVAADFKDGWLTFENANERRRLAPAPVGWEEMSLTELERLCGIASRAPRTLYPLLDVDPALLHDCKPERADRPTADGQAGTA